MKIIADLRGFAFEAGDFSAEFFHLGFSRRHTVFSLSARFGFLQSKGFGGFSGGNLFGLSR